MNMRKMLEKHEDSLGGSVPPHDLANTATASLVDSHENDIDDGAPIQLERDDCRGIAFSDDSKTLSEEHQVNGGSHVLPNDS